SVFCRREARALLAREGQPPARHAVVSGAAERVAIHLPQEDRLAFLRRELARLPQARLPGDQRPLVLALAGLDERLQFLELLGGGRGGGAKTRRPPASDGPRP